MKTGRAILLALVSLVSALATSATANSVTLWIGPYEYGGGGEITGQSVPSFLANYAPDATEAIGGGPAVGFETFCVEVNVDVAAGTQYSFTLSQQTSENQVLTLGAAELYYLFGKGLLGTVGPAYNYANAGGTRVNDAELLQSALWALMGQPNLFGQDPNTNPYLNFINTTLGAAALAPNGGAFPVDVMQIWDYNNIGSPAPNGYQDQLVLVPDGGSAILMLGSALTLLAGLGMRARKMA